MTDLELFLHKMAPRAMCQDLTKSAARPDPASVPREGEREGERSSLSQRTRSVERRGAEARYERERVSAGETV